MNEAAAGRFMDIAVIPETGTDGAVENGKILTRGATVPTDGDKGYAKGCLFINTAATDESDLLYANIGTAASANFNLVTVASD